MHIGEVAAVSGGIAVLLALSWKTSPDRIPASGSPPWLHTLPSRACGAVDADQGYLR